MTALASPAHRGGAAILSGWVFRSRGRAGPVVNVTAGGITWLLVAGAHAQTDEIQVYDADINVPAQLSVQLHSNYTPIGRKAPDFEGGIVPNHTLNGVPEWAYGVTDWLELGAYLPLYSWTGNGRFLIDLAKLRAEPKKSNATGSARGPGNPIAWAATWHAVEGGSLSWMLNNRPLHLLAPASRNVR